MTEEAKQAKREYEKRWRERNPEKIKAIRRRYWEKKAARAKQEEQRNEPE